MKITRLKMDVSDLTLNQIHNICIKEGIDFDGSDCSLVILEVEKI